MPSLHHQILMANRQMCCICHQMPAMIFYIDGDKSNLSPSNLAALCPKHHKEARAGLLDSKDIQKSKYEWERGCLTVLMSLARLAGGD